MLDVLLQSANTNVKFGCLLKGSKASSTSGFAMRDPRPRKTNAYWSEDVNSTRVERRVKLDASGAAQKAVAPSCVQSSRVEGVAAGSTATAPMQRVANDERMQSRDECRSRGERRRGDAETRGRAEPEEQREVEGREKSSAEKREQNQRRRGAEQKLGAKAQRHKA